MSAWVPRIGRPRGCVAEGGVLGEVEDVIVGRVVGGADLLQDDMLLALEFVVSNTRVAAGYRRGCRAASGHVVLEHAGIIGGVSIAVAALISPPTASISSAISLARSGASCP